MVVSPSRSSHSWFFFDVGGTLFDDERVYQFQEKLVFDLLEEHQCNVTEEEFARAVRKARTLYIPKYLRHLIWIFTSELEKYEQVWNAYEQEFRLTSPEILENLIQPLPGIRDLLLDLKQTYRLGIVGTQPGVVRQRLKEEKMLDLFDIHAISSEMGLQKPDIRFYLAVLALAQCHAKDAVMVGDRLDNDVYPAKRLGMRTIRLKMGPHRNQPVWSPEYVPHYTVSSIRQLAKLILSEDFETHH